MIVRPVHDHLAPHQSGQGHCVQAVKPPATSVLDRPSQARKSSLPKQVYGPKKREEMVLKRNMDSGGTTGLDNNHVGIINVSLKDGDKTDCFEQSG